MLFVASASYTFAADISGTIIECEGEVSLVAKILTKQKEQGNASIYTAEIFRNGQQLMDPDGKASAAFTMCEEENSCGLANWGMGVFFPEYQLSAWFYGMTLNRAMISPLPFAGNGNFPQVACTVRWP